MGGGFGQEAASKREFIKGESRKEKVRKNFWTSNVTKQLKANLRDYSIDVRREWKFLKEYHR